MLAEQVHQNSPVTNKLELSYKPLLYLGSILSYIIMFILCLIIVFAVFMYLHYKHRQRKPIAVIAPTEMHVLSEAAEKVFHEEPSVLPVNCVDNG